MMWKRGGKSIIYKVQSDFESSLETQLQTKTFPVFSFFCFCPEECWGQSVADGEIWEVVSRAEIYCPTFWYTASFASGISPVFWAPAVYNELRNCAWRIRDVALRHKNWCPIDHSALPNFEKLQLENWFIVKQFDVWLHMHDLNKESVSDINKQNLQLWIDNLYCISTFMMTFLYFIQNVRWHDNIYHQ